MGTEKRQYGLFTAISMIVGIAIGAGVFFKTDEILKYTGGNVFLGVVVFCIGAFSIIFGSLTVAELAIRSKKSGGAIGYYEEYISEGVASGFGWFQFFVYFPTLGSVVSYVGSTYVCSLLGIRKSLESELIVSLTIISLFFILNIVSSKFGSYFQNATTIIKLIPLIVLTIAGFALAGTNPEIPSGVELVTFKDVGLSWIAALVPIAFTYDGWIITTSLTNEVKSPQKTMPRALTLGPIIVLVSYVMYFIGINKMLGPEYIMSVGNRAINVAGNKVFGGQYGEKILLIFVIISVLGVINGVILGAIKMPSILRNKKMFPGFREDFEEKVTLKSCVVPFLTFVFWSVVNYIFFKFKVLAVGSDVSSISIVFSYVFYTLLYVKVMKMRKSGEIHSNIKGYVFPILAIVGALIIIIGGFMSDPIYAVLFSIFCVAVSLAGYKYFQKNSVVTGK